MASLDGVVVFMNKLRRIHEFLTNTKVALQAMSVEPESERSEESRALVNERLYEVNYILDKFWEIVEGE